MQITVIHCVSTLTQYNFAVKIQYFDVKLSHDTIISRCIYCNYETLLHIYSNIAASFVLSGLIFPIMSAALYVIP